MRYRRAVITGMGLILAGGWLASCSQESGSLTPGPVLVHEVSGAIAVAVVDPSSITSTGGREGYRSYSVDLSTAAAIIPVTDRASSLGDTVEFEREVEYWEPIEDLVSDYDQVVLLIRKAGGTVLGLRGSNIVIIDWSSINGYGQTEAEEAAVFNVVADGADPATALAELAKVKLEELDFAPGLGPDGSGLGLRLLDALRPESNE